MVSYCTAVIGNRAQARTKMCLATLNPNVNTDIAMRFSHIHPFRRAYTAETSGVCRISTGYRNILRASWASCVGFVSKDQFKSYLMYCKYVYVVSRPAPNRPAPPSIASHRTAPHRTAPHQPVEKHLSIPRAPSRAIARKPVWR